MEFEFGVRADSLRSTLRTLIEQHVPEEFLGAFTHDPKDLEVTERFSRLLAERGLLTMAWPREYGGLDSSLWEQTVVREEMWAHHEPRGAQYMGVNWVGPTIMKYGTAEQRETHLPPIAAGEVVWCQGFSEPDAGSDLPALRTSATKNSDGTWRINGQKCWTSYAMFAKWCFLLARTGEPGRRGISVFLLPMNSPGITVRPIPSMLGPHHLNEVFFDDVVVRDEDILGVLDGGWKIVQDVIAFERVGISRYARCDRLLQWAPEAMGDLWTELPENIVSRWAGALLQTRSVRLLAYKVVQSQEDGKANPASVAAYRTAATLLDQQVAEILMDMVGSVALGGPDPDSHVAEFAIAVEDHWKYAQAATVASGTLEMQRNAIGRTFANHG
ncbi:acyl-CoA dehydrogenase family protein [Rhodococcoides yunnanense]|uniref:acyl-CoA dehydrogenase family protein n=1 Tax=Rhodococcoides yunnanense TaxID=278209 RepID=UPI000933AA54|nr:acyl-CoA dehydrogenase family protein [Rhodococcus yunnanensis]